jgi:succinyl-diaminopimelate desuccinylase
MITSNNYSYIQLLSTFIEKSDHIKDNSLQNFIASTLQKFNIKYELLKVGENHSILISSFYKNKKEDSEAILLNGHVDVVSPGNNWSRDPFKPYIIDGKMFGRGTSDMKSGLAALLIAYIELFLDKKFHGNLKFISTTLEEKGCLGAKILIKERKDFFKDIKGIIIGEPTNLMLKLKQKGALWFKFNSFGKIGHSSNPNSGENAIQKMIETIDLLKKDLKNIKGLTLSLNKIKGGIANNIVPDFCEAVIDIRIPPNNDYENLKNKITNFLRNKNIFFKELLFCPPFDYSNANTPFINLAKKFFSELDLFEENNDKVNYFTDGSIFQELNAPIIIVGPGEINQAHKKNEFVYINKYLKSISLYKKFLKNLF